MSEVERGIYMDKVHFSFPTEHIKDLNDTTPKQFKGGKKTWVYLVWEVLNSVTLHSIDGSESVALYHSRMLRDSYERHGMNCKIRIDRTLANHFFASTMVDYTYDSPLMLKTLQEWKTKINNSERDAENKFFHEKELLMNWGVRHGYISEEEKEKSDKIDGDGRKQK